MASNIKGTKDLKKFWVKVAKSCCNHEKGFTLVELLIVVSILGILAGIIVPNVTSFVKKGDVAVANEELASIQTAAVANLPESGVYSSEFGVKNGSLGLLAPSINRTINGSYWIKEDGSVNLTTSPTTGADAAAAGFPYYPNLTWDTTALQFK